MGKYTGYKCAACSEVFSETDDVVVCPVCGAPHHRTCYNAVGGCAASHLHEEGKAYEPVFDKKEDTETVSDKVCPKCGTKYSGDFCPACGERNNPYNNGQNPFNGNVRYITPEQFRYGGLNPDEKINETSIRELADYTGPSSGSFIRKWYAMFKSKGYLSVNFAALIFGPFYFLFRKMWFWGILYFIFSLIASVPSYYIMISSYLSVPVDTAMWTTMAQWFSLISLAVKIAGTVFFNKLYLSKAESDIKSGKKSGGTSILPVLAAIAATFLFSELLMLLL